MRKRRMIALGLFFPALIWPKITWLNSTGSGVIWKKNTFALLLKKEISPIARFKELEELTTSELAARTGLSKRKVKRQLTHRHFLKASVEELQKYADVFNIPIANFFQIISTKEDGKWNMGYDAKAAKKLELTISQKTTENPLLVITNPEKTNP